MFISHQAPRRLTVTILQDKPILGTQGQLLSIFDVDTSFTEVNCGLAIINKLALYLIHFNVSFKYSIPVC